MELTENGDVISWGGNQYGELGDDTYLDSDAPILQSNVPVHVACLTNIIKIAGAGNHSLAVDTTGQLWAWGDNAGGELGDGLAKATTNVPELIAGVTNVVEIAAIGLDGFPYSAAIEGNGTVWTWGTRYIDEFMPDYATNVPSEIQGLTNAVAVAIDGNDTEVLLSDGSVWVSAIDWGQDFSPPSAIPNLTNIVKIRSGGNGLLALDTNGVVWLWQPIFSPTPMTVGLSNVVQIAAGDFHFLALDDTGQLWAWGDDSADQLGDGGDLGDAGYPAPIAGMTNIIAIEAGPYDTVAVDADGNLWQFGASVEDNHPLWNWGGSDGLPALSPKYIDFYNGNLPQLTVLSGNNLTNYAGLEWQMTLRITDSSGTPLTNAPVSVEVEFGDVTVRTNSGGTDFDGLRMISGTNGEVSFIGYVEDANVTNALIRILANSRGRLAETNFQEHLSLLPTISINSPSDGDTVLVASNQPVEITVDAEPGPGLSITEVDFYGATNDSPLTLIGVSTVPAFSISWTNTIWWSSNFVGQYTIAAAAKDSLGTLSATQNISVTVALDTFWFGIPDYLDNTNGTLAAWEMKYFGYYGVDPNGDYDNDGTNNITEFSNGTDPNDISFSISFPNQYVAANVVTGAVTIAGGVPSYYAVSVNNTNFSSATWSAYLSPAVPVSLGSTNGDYDVWIGLRGLPPDAHQAWIETTLILDSVAPTVSTQSKRHMELRYHLRQRK